MTVETVEMPKCESMSPLIDVNVCRPEPIETTKDMREKRLRSKLDLDLN